MDVTAIANAAGLARRPETDADEAFLRAVYASTREPEMAMVAWTVEQKDAFLRQQFDAQRFHYRKHFPNAAFDILTRAGEPVGRLYLDCGPVEWRILDIALVPEHRNAGLGSALIRSLMTGANAAGAAVGLSVETFNPARRLYDRLGFAVVQEDGIYLSMTWPAPAVETSP